MPLSEQLSAADEDFNLPTQERLNLLDRLQALLGDVPPHFWAACHLCSIPKLELLVQTAEINPDIVYVAATQAHIMAKMWCQRESSSAVSTPRSTPRSSPVLQRLQSSLPRASSSSSANTPPAKRQKIVLGRSKSARDKALARDGSRCILTGTPIIEVAHIYPFYLLPKEDDKFGKRHVFWQMLKNFWPKEKISFWEAAVFPDGQEKDGLETPRNLITLSADAHRSWNKGAFALKPVSVSEDNTVLTVQFFWQVKQPLLLLTINLTTEPLSTRGLNENDGSRLFFPSDDSRIKSGDLIELKTDDPETKPLPSIALLEMQWFLQRVMGMTGVADDLDSEDHFSDSGRYKDSGNVSNCGEFDETEDYISNMGLDEGGDESFLSNVTGLSDPIMSDDTSLLPSIEAPKNYTEETEEMSRDRALL